MFLNTISAADGRVRKSKRVGRGMGSGFGKTAGRGHKGLKSRSGGKVAPGFEGGQMPLRKRLPKFGFSSRIAAVTAEIRLSELNKVDGDLVDMDSLLKADLIGGAIKRVKIFSSGEVTRPLTVVGLRVTEGARKAIEAAGGKIEEVPSVSE